MHLGVKLEGEPLGKRLGARVAFEFFRAVRLFMCLQRVEYRKGLAAVRTRVGQFAVVLFLVPTQDVCSRIRLVAFAARKRSLARVNANVPSELGGNGKLFLAVIARVRSIAGVELLVQPERAVAEEPFVSLRALEIAFVAVYPSVLVEVDLLAEALPTVRAQKREPDAHAEVPIEMRGAGKAPVALRTWIRPVARVRACTSSVTNRTELPRAISNTSQLLVFDPQAKSIRSVPCTAHTKHVCPDRMTVLGMCIHPCKLKLHRPPLDASDFSHHTAEVQWVRIDFTP